MSKAPDNCSPQVQAQHMRFSGTLIDGHGNIWRYKNGILHNDHGPTVENKDGYIWWIVNGKNHRLDGMAVEYPIPHFSGIKGSWYVNGEKIDVETQQQFERWKRLKIFL